MKHLAAQIDTHTKAILNSTPVEPVLHSLFRVATTCAPLKVAESFWIYDDNGGCYRFCEVAALMRKVHAERADQQYLVPGLRVGWIVIKYCELGDLERKLKSSWSSSTSSSPWART